MLTSQNGANIEENSMEESIANVMHLGIDFLKDADGFLKVDEIKFEQKTMDKSIQKAVHESTWKHL